MLFIIPNCATECIKIKHWSDMGQQNSDLSSFVIFSENYVCTHSVKITELVL